MYIFVSTAGAGARAATAVRATDFLNSIGVNVHISQGVDSTQKVIPALSYIGAREAPRHPGFSFE
jgi:hypothetical protein